MASKELNPFTNEGNENPEWMQHITNRDALVSEIAAYFLSGEKLKPETVCFMPECVMPSRHGSYCDTSTKLTLYNPMMLCFFCNRTFHTGCLDLDANLINEEAVPWRCNECKRDLHNKHCQDYFKSTGYRVKLIERRARMLLMNFLPERESPFKGDIEFLETDMQSFKRRAVAIIIEEDPEADCDTDTVSPLLLKQVMKARADKRATQSQQANDSVIDESLIQSTSSGYPSFHTAHHSSTVQSITGSNTVANALNAHYTAQSRAPSIERNDYEYRPQNIGRSFTSGNLNTSYSQSQDHRSQQSMNQSDISHLITRLATAQERTEEMQLLEARRKAIPKISEFNGEESKWLTFKQDVERYRRNCKFDDETVKLYIRGALKGDAYTIVRDIFDLATLDVIMATLKSAFGDEMHMVRRRSEELQNFKLGSTLYKSEAVKLQAAIQTYFASCNYAGIGYINTNSVAEAIFCQFNSEDRQRCKEFYRMKNPTCTTIVMDVQTIYDYLLYRMPLLDDAPIKKKSIESEVKYRSKSFQVHTVSVPSSSPESYKFDIRDKNRAPSIGYDLVKVAQISKACGICHSSEHYAVQCPQYKEKAESDRLKLIWEKGLCKNCILTSSHRAMNCDVKTNCGFKIDKSNRCSARHHVSIHDAEIAASKRRTKDSFKKRKSNTRANTEKAVQKANGAKAENPPVATSAKEKIEPEAVTYHSVVEDKEVRQYDVLTVGDCHLSAEAPKSVKVFRVKFWGPKGHVIALAIGDSGSEVTLMRDDLRAALGIEGTPHTLHLQWADRTTRTCNATQFSMQIQGMDKDSTKHNLNGCFAIKDLKLPSRTLDMKSLKKNFPHLKNVPFDGYENEEPVILIGSPHANLIEGCELVEDGAGGPVAVKTRIGWTVYGGMRRELKNCDKSVNELTTVDTVDATEEAMDEASEKRSSIDDIRKLLEGYFSIESLGIRPSSKHYTLNEKKALELLEQEMKILDNGSVEVPLLWNKINDRIPELPNNYTMVYQRQFAQEKRLRKDPKLLQAYNNNVKELLSLEFLREATEKDMKGEWKNVWYLPMSLVVNENKNPPKMRNVYDASCNFKGYSLNSNLLKGPDMLVNILQPLIRMRMNKIAFTADVKSMFNMIRICERDQQCQRILYRESDDKPMKTYIANVMLFGPTSSPVTSQYVKNETAKKWMEKYPAAARTLTNYTYMDDVLTSAPDLESAKSVAEGCIEICKSINWQLVSFQSNSVELLKALPPHTVKKDAIPLLESDDENHVTKQNIFIQLVKDFDLKPTKRDQASTLARIYDVLGLISFFTIRGKILLQRSWIDKTAWDQVIDDKSAKDWKKWLQQLCEIEKLKFPRQFARIDALKEAHEIKLHIFCDAGAEAYGAVAYLVVKSKEGIDSSLVMVKAKVTPLRLKTKTKIMEIPRLELLGALLAARLFKTISSMLDEITVESFFWCDSEVVLRWILDPNQSLMKYAIGPIEEILEISDRGNWRYVPTQMNVADMCTKMRRINFASDAELWMKGPKFIIKDEEHWPKTPKKLLTDDCRIANNIYFEKLNFSTHKLPPIDCPIASDDAIERLSPSIKASWPKLKRAIARALKIYMDVFIPVVFRLLWNNKRALREVKRLTDSLEYLSPNDLERAEHFIFRKIQRDEFPEEYKALKSRKMIKNQMMNQLNVFMDHEGIIRINSRANLNSEIFPQQFSPLLPRKSVYVTALLAYYHEKYNHISTESQIAEIRTRVWIPQLRTALKSIKARCNLCRLKNARPYAPQMAPLPNDRVNPELKPFEVTGVDVLGPLKPTVNGNVKKIYILIFVCTLTRYIHLHLLDSLESLRVLEAIVTFWTAYGPVRKLISDNGTNFTRAAKILKEDNERAKVFAKQQTLLGSKLAELYGVEWQFNAVHAPWFGGMYERLIKEVKRALAGTLDKRKINRIELNIAVQEAAHRINCRPLTENAVEAEDREILTPHHLAKNRSGWPLLPGIHKNVYATTPDRSIYRRGRIVADEIMRKFTARYLPILTKRSKWHKSEAPPKIGDLVLVIEPNKTRREWQRAKTVKIHIGRDGVARVADVEMADGRIKKNRALRNLAKLNLCKSLHEGEKCTESTTAEVSTIFQNSNDEANLIEAKRSENKTKLSIAANFTPINIRENNLQNKLFISTMGKKTANKAAENAPKMLLIEGVSRYMKVSEFIRELAPELSSIVGAMRIYDYEKKMASDSFAVFLLNVTEFDRLMRARHEVNMLNGLRLNFPDLISGTGYFPTSFTSIEEDRIKDVPKPLAVFDLPKMKGATSIYASKLIETFEQTAVVTGFKWCVNMKQLVTRTFGFILMDERSSVIALADRKFQVFNSTVYSKLCESTAVLIHARHSDLLNDQRKAILIRRLIQANWLNAKLTEIQDPALSNPRGDSIVITLDNDKRVEADYDAGPSRTISMVAERPVPSSSNALQRHATDPSLVKSAEKTKRTSKFIKIKFRGYFPFGMFHQRVMRYVKKFKVVTYSQKDEESLGFIEFNDESIARKFKKVIEGLRKGKELSIKYDELNGKLTADKAKMHEIEPEDDAETIYVVHENKKIFRRTHSQFLTKVQ